MSELADHLPVRLGKAVRTMVRIKSIFLSLSTFILALTFLFVVVSRYILHTDLFAYEEWLLPLCFWLFFLGSAVGTYEDTQIKADILESYITNPRTMWIRRVLLGLIEFVVSVFLVYWGILMLIDEIASYPQWQTTIALRIPFVVPRLGIVVGFSFMAFYSALHLYVLFRGGPAYVTETLDGDGAPDGSGKAHSS